MTNPTTTSIMTTSTETTSTAVDRPVLFGLLLALILVFTVSLSFLSIPAFASVIIVTLLGGAARIAQVGNDIDVSFTWTGVKAIATRLNQN